MKIINLALSPLLAASLLTGCVMESGEESIGSEDEAAQADEGATGEASELRPIDGRAEAVLEAERHGSLPTTNAELATWFSGTISAGGLSHHYWNNAGSQVYAVGLSPVGASTASPCALEVIRTWDVQKPDGEREFHFQIKNIGSIACGANILLEGKAPTNGFALAGLEPGLSRTVNWNNANPLTSSHFVNVIPAGASPANSCQIELTRQYYVRQLTGERELRMTFKNIGAISCHGQVVFGLASIAISTPSTGALAPNATDGGRWNNANPLTRIYVTGALPALGCATEITRSYYRQVINTTGAAEREYFWEAKNIDTSTCSSTVLINAVD